MYGPQLVDMAARMRPPSAAQQKQQQQAAAAAAGSAATDVVAAAAMRCGGCASKVDARTAALCLLHTRLDSAVPRPGTMGVSGVAPGLGHGRQVQS